MNKIDINKQYKTRSGLPVRIYAVDVDDDFYNVHGSYNKDGLCHIEAWSNTGKYDNGFKHDLDLIEVG